jgi:hypothetical protein
MVAPPSIADGHAVVQPPPVRVVGYVRGPRTDGLDCDRPLLVMRHDGATGLTSRETWLCSNHRSDRCGPCSSRYRRRVESVAGEGIYIRGNGGGYFYLLTLTAPGSREHYHANGRPCRCTPPGGVDLAEWNPTAAKRWNALLVAIERRYLVRPSYFRAAEVQDRGAIHYHVLLWTPRKLQIKALRELAVTAGFGHEIDLQPVDRNSRKVARYVSKYVAKSTDMRDEVPWAGDVVDLETGELTHGDCRATYRTWSQARSWGTSMADIRAAARDKATWLQSVRAAGVNRPPTENPLTQQGESLTGHDPPGPS